MASKVVNRAKMSVTGTPGTGAFTLNAAVTNFQTFAAAGVANADQVGYLAEGAAGVEIGLGAYTASGTSQARTTILFSTNAGAAVSFGSDVLVTATALAQDIARPIDRQWFTASGTWTKPKGFGANAVAHIECWGAGAGGDKSGGSGGAGGGGGSYFDIWIPLSSLGATETVTVGAGGAGQTTNNVAGNPGGNSSFGSWLTGYGGCAGFGSNGTGGAGGSQASPSGSAGVPTKSFGLANFDPTTPMSQFVGGGANNQFAPAHGGSNCGGGGGCTISQGAGGGAVNGGGGGGGAISGGGGFLGGVSAYGGNGGAAATSGVNNGSPGVAPGGGGGGTAGGTGGAGARGEVRVTVFDGV